MDARGIGLKGENKMKLKEALRIANELHPRQQRGLHRDINTNITRKHELTPREQAHSWKKGKITGVHL